MRKTVIRKIAKAAFWGAGLIGSLLTFLATVSPQEVESGLAGWTEYFDVQDVPKWVNEYGMYIGLGFILAALVASLVAWWPRWKAAWMAFRNPCSNPARARTDSSRAIASVPGLPDEKLRTFFDALADPSGNQAVEILNRLCSRLSEKTTLADQYVATLVRNCVIHVYYQVRTELIDVLKLPDEGGSQEYSPGEDQLLFGRYYELYQALAIWLDQTAGLLGLDLREDQDYKRWRKADENFLAKLRELIVQRGYDQLSNSVRRVGGGESVRHL